MPVCAQAGESRLDLSAMVRAVTLEEWPPGKVPAGSGFFVSADGDILTASHVIAGCKHVSIRDGGGKTSASVVGVDSRVDAALLHAHTRRHAFLAPANAGAPPDARVTLFMRSWANGTAAAITVRLLEPSARSAGDGLLKLSGWAQPGASGAAVVNSRGDVEGYVVGRMANRHDIAMAVPAESLRHFLAYFSRQRNPLRDTDTDDEGAKDRSAAKFRDAAVAVACAR
jgi:serine protease Do